MQQQLLEKLWAYIAEFNPELMFSLQENYSVRSYLEAKVKSVEWLLESLHGIPEHLITELCMNELTADLKPSKYQYIRKILERDFGAVTEVMRENGVLTCEIISMIENCTPIFRQHAFSEATIDNRELQCAVIGSIEAYLTQADLSV